MRFLLLGVAWEGVLVRFLFYRSKASALSSGEVPLPDGFRVSLWRPRVLSIKPAGAPLIWYSLCWLLHQLHVFANRDYCVLLIYSENRLVHRSTIFPRYFRYRFMGIDDLHVADTWTDPDYRGRGLAPWAIRELVRRLKRRGREFWYVVSEDNLQSIRAVEKAGFSRVGSGTLTRRLGLRFLAYFKIDARDDA